MKMKLNISNCGYNLQKFAIILLTFEMYVQIGKIFQKKTPQNPALKFM